MLKLISFLIASLVLGIIGCKQPTDSQNAGWGIKVIAHSSSTINVCWENRTEDDRRYKDLRAAFSNYARTQFDRTNIRLVGWQDCQNPSSNNEIRITWTDSEENQNFWQDGKSIIGRGIGGARPSPFWATLRPSKISSVTAAPTLALNSKNYENLKVEVGNAKALNWFSGAHFLHELGHSVGLLHETAHPNNTTFCSTGERFKDHLKDWADVDAEATLRDNIVATKKYDPKSIMNYCWINAFRSSGRLLELSESDVFTINALYPQ